MKLRTAAVTLVVSGAGLALPVGIAHADPVGINDRLGSAQPGDGGPQTGQAGPTAQAGPHTQHVMRPQEIGASLVALPFGGLR